MDNFDVIVATQALFQPFHDVLYTLSLIGYASNYLIISAMVFWSGAFLMGVRLLSVVSLCTFLFSNARLWIHSPRPYALYPELFNGWIADTNGMPSGHSMLATAFWGTLFIYYKQRSLRLLSVTMIVLMALSRLYLGVHFPSQILAGMVIGVGAVLLVSVFEHWLIPALQIYPSAMRLFFLLVLALIPTVGLEAMIATGFAQNPDDTSQFNPEFRSWLEAGILWGITIVACNMPASSFHWRHLLTRAIPCGILFYLLKPYFYHCLPYLHTLMGNYEGWLKGCLLAMGIGWIGTGHRKFRRTAAEN